MKLTHRVLHNQAKPIQFERKVGKITISNFYANQLLVADLIKLMDHEGGIGLAAPQCGHSIRLFVMRIDKKVRICFNPEIVESNNDLVDFDEGCLSFPGKHCIIKRPSSIQVRYQDARGAWTEETLDGLEARCFQHELDHLNGITMLDRYKEQNAK